MMRKGTRKTTVRHRGRLAMKNLRVSIQGAVMAALFKLFKGRAADEGSGEKDAGVRALKSVLKTGAKGSRRMPSAKPQVNRPGAKFQPRRRKYRACAGAHNGRRTGPTWKSARG
jgi:hypothetical protein